MVINFQLFKRSGNDLIIQQNIELVESLCGFQKVIRTLDERDIVITVMPGEVTKHCEVKCVMNEGRWCHISINVEYRTQSTLNKRTKIIK